MITHNRLDREMMATVESSTTASTAAVSEAVIDLQQAGGVDEENFILEWGSASQAVTLDIVTDDSADGNFTEIVHVVTTTASTADKLQIRVPLACKRFVKLSATTGETPPSAALEATLYLAV